MMDIEYFIKKHNLLLSKLSFDFVRQNYFDLLNSDEKMVGLIGARGVGKTTLLLQYLSKIDKKALYIIADDAVFTDIGLYEIADEFYALGGRVLAIDEIHKYKNWAQELKNIYDSFPDILIRFSGSSQLNILYEKYDLSRRAVIHKVPILSFREYLGLKYNLDLQIYGIEDILHDSVEISSNLVLKHDYLYGEFRDYLRYGAYPFFIEGIGNFPQKLFNALEKIIYEDIPSLNRINFEHIAVFKKLIFRLIETNKPYRVNIASLARDFGISEPTLYTYLDILARSEIVNSIKKYSKKVSKKPDKLLFGNTNIYNSYAGEFGIEVDIGTLRETFFVSCFEYLKESIYYSDIGDFRYKDYIFEIGGKNKSFAQIKDVPHSFLAIDIDYSVSEKKIPLWLFGFMW